jgi:hypothetical protein
MWPKKPGWGGQGNRQADSATPLPPGDLSGAELKKADFIIQKY